MLKPFLASAVVALLATVPAGATETTPKPALKADQSSEAKRGTVLYAFLAKPRARGAATEPKTGVGVVLQPTGKN